MGEVLKSARVSDERGNSTVTIETPPVSDPHYRYYVIVQHDWEEFPSPHGFYYYSNAWAHFLKLTAN